MISNRNVADDDDDVPLTSSLCLQSTVVLDLPGGVPELDSDMADITQSFPSESMLGGDEDGELTAGEMDVTSGKLAGLLPSDHGDHVSASGHIASSLGINPHTLQVESSSTRRKCIISTEHRHNKSTFFGRS